MFEPPIACSLSDADLANVAARYARAAERYQAVVHYDHDCARIDLRGEKASLAALLDEMIAREGDCCAHLRFEVVETVDGYHVELSVHGAPGIERPVLHETIPVLFPTARYEDHGRDLSDQPG